VSIMVAFFLVVAMACAALTLDLGNLWQTQRRLHTASDAAALAAASEYAAGDVGCADAAPEYVEANSSGAVTSCTAVPFDTSFSSGYVTVGASTSVSFPFASLFGVDSGDVTSRASVRWGPPKGVTGLRPLGLCLYYPGLESWLNLPDGPTGPSGEINVPFSNAFGNGCNASSNWGWLDLSGSAGGNDINDWLDSGYDGMVPVPSDIGAESGHLSSAATHLAGLVASGEHFPIVMYDSVNGTGSTAVYHLVAVAMAQLVDFKITGVQADQFFTFRLYRAPADGECCGTGPNTGAIVSSLCAVNDEPEPGECGL
jgi:hypothetical protein